MYQVGDRVVYGIHGVCEVVAIERRRVDRKELTYLALEPAGHGNSRFLIPAHNEVAMSKLQRILTVPELESLLRDDSLHDGQWIAVENLRKQRYRELTAGADRRAILEMLSTVYRHKQAQIAAGKKVHQCDDNFLRDGEKLIAGEIAVIMNLDFPQALAYLRQHIQAQKERTR